MLIDGRSMPDGVRVEADLCVIGCGPAGMTVARELAGRGMGVVVLDSGGPGRERSSDRLGAGESVGHPYMGLETSRVRGIGGTSLHWQMQHDGGDEGWIARPLDDLDFEARPGLPLTGWPFARSELDEPYRRAQALCGMGPWAYQPEDWPADPNRPFDLPPDRFVTNLFQRGERRFSENAGSIVASPYVRVIHHATVVRLVQAGDGSRIDAAQVATTGGRHIRVAARRFVLAAGGIDNPRLLLASATANRPAGIGNQNDLVGRCFMERLSARAGALVPATVQVVEASGLYRSHVVDGTRIHGVVSLAPDVVRSEGLRNAAFWLRGRQFAQSSTGVASVLGLYRALRREPRQVDTIRQHVVNIGRDLPDVVRTAGHHLLRRPEGIANVLQLGVQAEQLPNLDSRVTLGHKRDRFGTPLARLDWRPSDSDRESIERSVQLLDAGFRAAGIGRVIHPFGTEQPPVTFVGNWHHMGTTRMASDSAQGVVDSSGRVHGVENLYLAGSSIFPTAGFANPTLTIVALAFRLADELRAESWGELAS